MDNFYNKLIKPIRDKCFNDVITNSKIDVYSPYDKEFSWAERTIPITEFKNNTLSYTSEWLIGLDKFPFMYVMNGNSHSLDIIFRKFNNIAFKKNDYLYYSGWHNYANKPFQELEYPRDVNDIVFTWPGYSNGDNNELEFALKTNAKRMHLDCAYLGLVEPKSIDVSNFETVSISFSKTLSIPYNRISILFSKNEISELTLLNKLGYVNLSGVKLANHIMHNIPLSYWWDTYGHNINNICYKNNLSPTKSILFAYKNNSRISLAPFWNVNQL